MQASDLRELPEQTRKLVFRLFDLGLDRSRIHGLFVVLGLYAGAPDTQERLDQLFSRLNPFLPIDRSRNIDEVVGHLYDGFDRQINEFCFRSGVQLNFREISIPGVAKTVSVVYPRDEGLLIPSVSSVDKLSDASRLYDSFLQALGQVTLAREASLLEAFTCGIFQIQLHARADVSGARQIAALINGGLPLFYGQCFKSLAEGQVDYFVGLEGGQVPLLNLMQSMEISYARQMWGFQSSLFFQEQERIAGLDELTPAEWHDWVLQKARAFDAAYPNQLAPFSQSNVSLADVPGWGSEIANFRVCDDYIHTAWGFQGASLRNDVEVLEYRALVVHLIYSSLTQSRGALN